MNSCTFIEQVFAEAAMLAWSENYDASKDVFRFSLRNNGMIQEIDL